MSQLGHWSRIKGVNFFERFSRNTSWSKLDTSSGIHKHNKKKEKLKVLCLLEFLCNKTRMSEYLLPLFRISFNRRLLSLVFFFQFYSTKIKIQNKLAQVQFKKYIFYFLKKNSNHWKVNASSIKIQVHFPYTSKYAQIKYRPTCFTQ